MGGTKPRAKKGPPMTAIRSRRKCKDTVDNLIVTADNSKDTADHSKDMADKEGTKPQAKKGPSLYGPMTAIRSRRKYKDTADDVSVDNSKDTADDLACTEITAPPSSRNQHLSHLPEFPSSFHLRIARWKRIRWSRYRDVGPSKEGVISCRFFVYKLETLFRQRDGQKVGWKDLLQTHGYFVLLGVFSSLDLERMKAELFHDRLGWITLPISHHQVGTCMLKFKLDAIADFGVEASSETTTTPFFQSFLLELCAKLWPRRQYTRCSLLRTGVVEEWEDCVFHIDSPDTWDSVLKSPAVDVESTPIVLYFPVGCTTTLDYTVKGNGRGRPRTFKTPIKLKVGDILVFDPSKLVHRSRKQPSNDTHERVHLVLSSLPSLLDT